jgi:hypothetical protein
MGMLERGELSQITANAELADRLLATARQHLASVRLTWLAGEVFTFGFDLRGCGPVPVPPTR